MSVLKTYHFDLGNSTDGPVGYCARIRAHNQKQALEILRESLPEESEIINDEYDEDGCGVEYIAFYTNDQKVSVKDIDEWDFVLKEDA